MPLDAGDIVLVEFPYTNRQQAKRRPALVLTNAAYNRRATDFLAAFITSKQQRDPWSLPVTNADLRDGSLVKPSWIRTDKIASIEHTMAGRTVGTLNEDALAATRQRIRDLIVDPPR